MSYTTSITPRGEFISTSSQYVADTTVAQAVTYNSTSLHGIGTDEASPSTQIILPSIGDYRLTFSAMCYTESNGEETIDIWLRKNGTTNVPNSSTRVDIPKQGAFAVMAASFVVSSTASTDYYELMMCGSSNADSTGIAVTAASVADPVRPVAPSMVVAISKISN